MPTERSGKDKSGMGQGFLKRPDVLQSLPASIRASQTISNGNGDRSQTSKQTNQMQAVQRRHKKRRHKPVRDAATSTHRQAGPAPATARITQLSLANLLQTLVGLPLLRSSKDVFASGPENG